MNLTSISHPDPTRQTIKLKHGLPDIPGVRPLSRNEIKKDINEIEYFNESDSDSTSSVLSDDILVSTYPVKPRRHPKTNSRDKHEQKTISKSVNIETDHVMMDDTIEFLRIVETARPEVYYAEKERENLEIRYEGLRDRCLSLEAKFKKRKAEQEALLRVLQTQCRTTCQAYDIQCYENLLLLDILNAVRDRKRIVFEHSNKPDDLTTLEVQSERGPEWLYTSQVLDIPTGPVKVTSIDKEKSEVTILPIASSGEQKEQQFPIGTVLQWLSVAKSHPDYYHTSNISKRFKELEKRTLGLTPSQQQQIRSALEKLPSDPIEYSLEVSENKESDEEDEDEMRPRTRSSRGVPVGRKEVPDAWEYSAGQHVKTESNSQGHSDNEDDSDTLDEDTQAMVSFPYLDPSKKLHMLFVPAGTLPYIAERDMEETSETEVQYCSQVFNSCYRVRRPSIGDIEESDDTTKPISSAPTPRTVREQIKCLKRRLGPLLERIEEIKEEKRLAAAQVERSKMATIKTCQNISAARLGMFTSRVLHRQAMGNFSPDENAVPVQTTRGKNGTNGGKSGRFTPSLAENGNSTSAPKPSRRTQRAPVQLSLDEAPSRGTRRRKAESIETVQGNDSSTEVAAGDSQSSQNDTNSSATVVSSTQRKPKRARR